MLYSNPNLSDTQSHGNCLQLAPALDFASSLLERQSQQQNYNSEAEQSLGCASLTSCGIHRVKETPKGRAAHFVGNSASYRQMCSRTKSTDLSLE